MWETPGIVNIAGETIEEFVELAELREGVEGVAGIEVNVSCPNVRAGGAVFGADAQAVSYFTAALSRATTHLPTFQHSPASVDRRPNTMARSSRGTRPSCLIDTLV